MSKVLIAKKTDGVGESLAKFLNQSGHQAEFVSTARVAIEKIASGGFDVVLTGLEFNDECEGYDFSNSGIGIANAACEAGVKKVAMICTMPTFIDQKRLSDKVKIVDLLNTREGIKSILEIIAS